MSGWCPRSVDRGFEKIVRFALQRSCPKIWSIFTNTEIGCLISVLTHASLASDRGGTFGNLGAASLRIE